MENVGWCWWRRVGWWELAINLLGGGFTYVYFHPYLGKVSNLTNIFQMGWNHQPDLSLSIKRVTLATTSSYGSDDFSDLLGQGLGLVPGSVVFFSWKPLMTNLSVPWNSSDFSLVWRVVISWTHFPKNQRISGQVTIDKQYLCTCWWWRDIR